MEQLTLGKPGMERPYHPSFIAGDLVGDPKPLNTPIGVLIGCGLLPGASSGGSVMIGGKEWGVDHVAGIGRTNESGGSELIILGSDKSDVRVDDPDSNIGYVRNDGLTIITNLEEEKIILASLTAICDGWTAYRFNKLGLTVHKVGNMIIGIAGMSAKMPREFRIKATNGIETIAKPIDQ